MASPLLSAGALRMYRTYDTDPRPSKRHLFERASKQALKFLHDGCYHEITISDTTMHRQQGLNILHAGDQCIEAFSVPL